MSMASQDILENAIFKAFAYICGVGQLLVESKYHYDRWYIIMIDGIFTLRKDDLQLSNVLPDSTKSCINVFVSMANRKSGQNPVSLTSLLPLIDPQYFDFLACVPSSLLLSTT